MSVVWMTDGMEAFWFLLMVSGLTALFGGTFVENKEKAKSSMIDQTITYEQRQQMVNDALASIIRYLVHTAKDF
jgi:hypothetical protein